VDWNAQQHVIHTAPDNCWLAVERNSTVTIYHRKKEGQDIPPDASFPARTRNARLKEGWEGQGKIDTRWAHTLAARHDHSVPAFLASLADRLKRKEDKQPHWLFTRELARIQGAQSVIGIGATNPDPNFAWTAETHEDWAAQARTAETHPVVVWIAHKRASKEELIKLLSASGGRMCVAVLGEADKTTTNWLNARTPKRISLPRGTLCLQATKACESGQLKPVACKVKVRVWVIGDGDQAAMEDLTQQAFWQDPYGTIPLLRGAWWERFLKHDQAAPYMHVKGVLVATDGSVNMVRSNGDGPEEPVAGAGAAFRRSDGMADMSERVECNQSSLVPEIHGARMAMRATPKDVDLTILTDSAGVLWIADALTRKTFWRDFRDHPQLAAIKELARDLDERTALTRFVKVAAHKGCPMNELADELADEAAAVDSQVAASYIPREERDVWISGMGLTPLKSALGQIAQQLMQRRSEVLQARGTATTARLLQPAAGRQYLGAALKRLPTRAARRAIQITSNTFPSQARLRVWGKAPTALCPFCKQTAETTGHFSQVCPQFADARTAAHDKTWGAVWAVIMEYKLNGMEAIHDTRMCDTPLQVSAKWKDFKPDGILLARDEDAIILMEYKRCGGHSLGDVRKAQADKDEKYRELAEDLTNRNGRLFPNGARVASLACTYSGVLDEAHWEDIIGQITQSRGTRTPAMQAMEAGVRTALEAFSEMADARQCARERLGTP
jgi:ribonuclease HI